MPARIGPLCAAALQPPSPLLHLRCQRQHHKLFFHSSPIHRDEIDDKNHYETLNIQSNASPEDIKKSFYTLSKTHHPDHNHSDPNAPRRFMRISEAYSTLSNVERRNKYDRDVLRLHDRHQRPSSQTVRPGSYSSTQQGPAGGRPASGLSRRRGTFRGPPPSFYRSGGWGAHEAKRSAAHEGSTGAAGAHSRPDSPAGAESSGYASYNAGGMGPGQEPFGRGSASNEVPHFDQAAQTSHTRTHTRIDARRAQRVPRDFDPFSASPGNTGSAGALFVILVGVLGLAGVVPHLFPGGTVPMKRKTR